MFHNNQASARQLLLFLLLLTTSLTTSTRIFAAENKASSPPAREYTLGVFPYLAQPTLQGIFAPLAVELSTALGCKIDYQSAATFEKFMSNLEQEQYDIAHIQPFDYVAIASKKGYLPLATRMEKLTADFVVKAESPLQTIQDLRGKKIGMPPKVAAVSYLAQVALLQAGITPGKDVSLQYYNTHQSNLQHLLIGDIDVSAATKAIMRFFEAQSQRKFRIIMTSPEIPQTLFVVHQRVPPADRELIKKTLLATRLSGVDPTLCKIFVQLQEGGPYFRETEDKDYDDVRHYLKMISEK